MAPSFARSISFPLSPSRSKSTPAPASSAAYHARSISLPCRSHPIIGDLHTHIRAVRSWAQEPNTVAAGLAHIDALHAAIGDLLDLPESQAALSAAVAANDRLLDAFLRLADAHGSFQEAVVELKQDVAEALAAIRRRDGARLSSAVRSQRKAGKELARLAAAAACVRPSSSAAMSRLGLGGSAAEVEVTGLLMESAAVTAAASATLFNTVAAMSASASAAACSCRKTAALVCLIKKTSATSEEEKEMMALMERLEELEECIDELDNGSDKVSTRAISNKSKNKKQQLATNKQEERREEEMAPSFGRSISFPLSPASSKPRSSAACHVRSISLPCRSHPLLSHLQSHIAAVRSWLIHHNASSSSVAAGLAHIHALHAALADLLLLPDPQDTLRRATSAADRLLDAFLLLADAHRTFHESLLDLRQDVAEARAALRRADAARLAAAVRSQKKAEKELARLASSVNAGAGRFSPSSSRLGLGGATAEETEMAAALIDAAAASAAASSAVFAAAANMSSAAASSACKKTPAFAAFAKKASPETAEVALDRFEELEQCIDESESSCHKVFRSILHTRVALLNIQTPTF
uniref:DUF241 domain-containing protein n=1 Tax=Leersia perrieri TaxID=77586 RepID=A0A0D9WUA3_9ORYZ